MDALYANPDPVMRLMDALLIEQKLKRQLADVKWDAAYQARMLMTSSEISKIIEIDRRSIDYMVHKYLERYPHKEPPPHMHRDKITGYVDLR